MREADVAEWRTARTNGADLARLLAFGAMCAVDRIAARLAFASRGTA